ncbi:MAG TPA: type II secretion system F family protein, partial [Acidobacteriaceae bacterium]
MAARLGEFVAGYGFSKKLDRLIAHAGSESTVGGVLLTALALAVGAFLAARVFFPLVPVEIAALLLGAFLPVGLLKFKRSRRLKKFSVAMPDAIDLMARSLRAGHSIGAAIEMVGEQSVEPLAGEFARVFQQQRFGLRFRDALIEMSDRVPLPDLHFLVTAILVQRETGGDLTEILDRTTHVIRERVRIEGEVKVYTAQGRLTGWILSLLPVILLLLINIISPGYSALLFHDPTGEKLLYVGGGFILFGAFLISRIVDIKV